MEVFRLVSCTMVSSESDIQRSSSCKSDKSSSLIQDNSSGSAGNSGIQFAKLSEVCSITCSENPEMVHSLVIGGLGDGGPRFVPEFIVGRAGGGGYRESSTFGLSSWVFRVPTKWA